VIFPSQLSIAKAGNRQTPTSRILGQIAVQSAHKLFTLFMIARLGDQKLATGWKPLLRFAPLNWQQTSWLAPRIEGWRVHCSVSGHVFFGPHLSRKRKD
jgi:hypothetical protein